MKNFIEQIETMLRLDGCYEKITIDKEVENGETEYYIKAFFDKDDFDYGEMYIVTFDENEQLTSLYKKVNY